MVVKVIEEPRYPDVKWRILLMVIEYVFMRTVSDHDKLKYTFTIPQFL